MFVLKYADPSKLLPGGRSGGSLAGTFTPIAMRAGRAQSSGCSFEEKKRNNVDASESSFSRTYRHRASYIGEEYIIYIRDGYMAKASVL